MPVICPMCQLAFEASMPAASYFAWGCFRYFGSDLEQIEIARHLAQFLTLAGNLLRDVDGHVALGNPSRAADVHFGLDPLQARPMRIARELLFHELSPDFDISRQQFHVRSGSCPQNI